MNDPPGFYTRRFSLNHSSSSSSALSAKVYVSFAVGLIMLIASYFSATENAAEVFWRAATLLKNAIFLAAPWIAWAYSKVNFALLVWGLGTFAFGACKADANRTARAIRRISGIMWTSAIAGFFVIFGNLFGGIDHTVLSDLVYWETIFVLFVAVIIAAHFLLVRENKSKAEGNPPTY